MFKHWPRGPFYCKIFKFNQEFSSKRSSMTKMKFPETKWMSFPVKRSGPDRLAHDPENIIFKTISG